jgi:hypothetical protein
MTRQQAAEFIAHWAQLPPDAAAALLTQPTVLAAACRKAARATHPDLTGDEDTFKRLNVARDLLTGGGS